jgi:hypothetical protein
MREYVLSIDLAKRRDFFGIMVLKDFPRVEAGNSLLDGSSRVIHVYEIKAIEKYQNVDYTDMVDRIETIMNHRELRNNADLLVDGTGVGEPVLEMIRRRGLYPIPFLFHGGDNCKWEYQTMGEIFKGPPGQLAGARVLKEIRVPKKDLVSAGSILLQQDRVRLAPGRWGEEFRKQLLKFRGKVNENSKRTAYEADREADHDDLIVCYLMGAWWFLNRREKAEIPERPLTGADAGGGAWEPMEYM